MMKSPTIDNRKKGLFSKPNKQRCCDWDQNPPWSLRPVLQNEYDGWHESQSGYNHHSGSANKGLYLL